LEQGYKVINEYLPTILKDLQQTIRVHKNILGSMISTFESKMKDIIRNQNKLQKALIKVSVEDGKKLIDEIYADVKFIENNVNLNIVSFDLLKSSDKNIENIIDEFATNKTELIREIQKHSLDPDNRMENLIENASNEVKNTHITYKQAKTQTFKKNSP
jgi:hypothetical protein